MRFESEKFCDGDDLIFGSGLRFRIAPAAPAAAPAAAAAVPTCGLSTTSTHRPSPVVLPGRWVRFNSPSGDMVEPTETGGDASIQHPHRGRGGGRGRGVICPAVPSAAALRARGVSAPELLKVPLYGYHAEAERGTGTGIGTSSGGSGGSGGSVADSGWCWLQRDGAVARGTGDRHTIQYRWRPNSDQQCDYKFYEARDLRRCLLDRR